MSWKMTLAAGLVLSCAALFLTRAVLAAPLPPVQTASVCGRIVARSWHPEERKRAIPGASGSLSANRVFPAHYRITLEDYSGVGDAAARAMNFALGGAERDGRPSGLLLMLNHGPRGFPATGSRICVDAYRIWGDEGGTWSSYKALRPETGPRR